MLPPFYGEKNMCFMEDGSRRACAISIWGLPGGNLSHWQLGLDGPLIFAKEAVCPMKIRKQTFWFDWCVRGKGARQ